MLMIQNNLDPAVAQHPEELITYGGNGAVFQNWAQYRLAMKYLSEMEEDQTLVMYSGHPMGLFPSHKEAPRVVVTNGMVIPNYSQPDDWERMNALGVSQYGQMTAGSYMYIGPQGIVHGTTITVLNAGRMIDRKRGVTDTTDGLAGKLFVTAGLGGMSGAQPKAANIAGCVSVTAEVNPAAAYKRHEQGWVDHVVTDLDELSARVKDAVAAKRAESFAYLGNVVEVWEKFDEESILVDMGSDQTSLHNPWAGGYYPVGLDFESANAMMAEDPEQFKTLVKASLKRHADAVNKHTARGTYFFDYGNAFLLEASRAGADIMDAEGEGFKYPSYVQDIMGPMCFDYGFGPFRWVCCSGDPADLDVTDNLAAEVLERLMAEAPADIQQQMQDNVRWIREAKANKLVVGSQARILYADAQGRAEIASAFNNAIKDGRLKGPVVLGSRPPRRERDRQPVPRDVQHLRRLGLHRGHGRPKLRRRRLPRRDVDQPAQRRRRRMGRGDEWRVWHAHRRKRRQRAPPAFHAALGRQQRHRAPELGQKRRSPMGHRPRHGHGASPEGDTRQPRGRRPHRRRVVLT